jgi:tRNA(fMet)-specific endonuclease VapC
LNKCLLDTDILSEIGKGIDPVVARNATDYRRAFSHYTFTTVTVMEVIRGFQRKQSFQRLQAFLTSLPLMEVLPFPQPAAELAGRIAGELERVGRPIGIADTMIASIALEYGLEVATGNTAHFQRVQQLGYPLTLVNWRL